MRYQPEEFTMFLPNQSCAPELFSKDLLDLKCPNYVYKSGGKSIKVEVYQMQYKQAVLKLFQMLNVFLFDFEFQFDLECESATTYLSLIGTFNHVSRAICLTVVGHFSDRYGRRSVLIVGVVGSTILAYIRSFAGNYITFAIFEALEAGIGSCIYTTSYIMALEWVRAEHRVAFSIILTAMYPLGPIFLGIAGYLTSDFRMLLRVVFAPGILVLSYFWIAPESLRWLLTNSKLEQIRATIRSIESMNKTELSNATWRKIEHHCDTNGNENERKQRSGFMAVFRLISRSPILWHRFICCIFLWATLSMVSYGISITSTSILGDRHASFMIVAAAGFPAMLLCYYGITRLGRPMTLAFSLLSGGTFLLCSKVVTDEITAITFYFLAKCCITSAYTTLYLYQAEIWPTSIRNSVFGICSTAGRFGSVASTFLPLLVNNC